jgi:dTMP kinase
MMDPDRYAVIDGTQSVEAIHAEIIARVAELAALKRNAQGQQPNKFLKPIRVATTAVKRATKATTSATSKVAKSKKK